MSEVRDGSSPVTKALKLPREDKMAKIRNIVEPKVYESQNKPGTGKGYRDYSDYTNIASNHPQNPNLVISDPSGMVSVERLREAGQTHKFHLVAEPGGRPAFDGIPTLNQIPSGRYVIRKENGRVVRMTPYDGLRTIGENLKPSPEAMEKVKAESALLQAIEEEQERKRREWRRRPDIRVAMADTTGRLPYDPARYTKEAEKLVDMERSNVWRELKEKLRLLKERLGIKRPKSEF